MSTLPELVVWAVVRAPVLHLDVFYVLLEHVRELGDRLDAVVRRAAPELARGDANPVEATGVAGIADREQLVARRGEELGDAVREPRVDHDGREAPPRLTRGPLARLK